MPKEEELDIEIVDDLNWEETIEIEDESTDDSDNKSKNSDEDNTLSSKSKKSNWKKMSQELKKLRAEKAAWQWEDDIDEDEIEDSQSTVDENKLTRFLMKNNEALEYEDSIVETLLEFPNMSFEQAFTFAKANNSESTTSKSFTTKSVKQVKKVSDLTDDQALKHFKWNAAWFLDWQRKTGRTKF